MVGESRTAWTITMDGNPEGSIVLSESGWHGERRHCEPADAVISRETAERQLADDAPLGLVRARLMRTHHVQPGQARLGQGKPEVQVCELRSSAMPSTRSPEGTGTSVAGPESAS
jgi:hypothetical protein